MLQTENFFESAATKRFGGGSIKYHEKKCVQVNFSALDNINLIDKLLVNPQSC